MTSFKFILVGVILPVFLCLIPITLSAQSALYSLEGKVMDAESKSALVGVNIRVAGTPTGNISDLQGKFTLQVKAPVVELIFSYIGYQDQKVKVKLPLKKPLKIVLVEETEELEEVIVSARRLDDRLKTPVVGLESVSIEEIDNIPVLFGEKDVIKTLQYLPGVKTGGEGSTGFYVRGGAMDQNLVLLDGATVYNASHLMGFFSVFNNDVLEGMELYKGAPPAEYGGRLSAVLDIEMREGDRKKTAGSASIGLISSKASIETPIVTDKGSLIISGRRTYADLLYGMVDESFRNSDMFFYDLTMKAAYNVTEKDRISLSAYYGRDKMGYGDLFGFDWGNTTTTLEWSHLFKDDFASKFSVHYNKFDYVAGSDFMGTNIYSNIEDVTARYQLEKFTDKYSLKAGGELIQHHYKPNDFDVAEDVPGESQMIRRNALEGGAFVSFLYNFTPNFTLQSGLRYSVFDVRGPGPFYTFNDFGDPVEKRMYGDRESVATHSGWEPRLSFNYQFGKNNAIKGGYSRNMQYVHMVAYNASGSPVDVWFPATDYIPAQYGDQFSLGYFKGINDYDYEFSAELYYKKLHNVTEFKDGADIMGNPYFEAGIAFGEGRAYGLELLFRKNKGRFTGWASYTWSRTEKQFDEINAGSWFPTFYDRPHDFSLVGMYKLNKKWDISASWVYMTGNAVTFPSGGYWIEDKYYPVYGDRNQDRMPATHRLDIGANLKLKRTKHYEHMLSFSIYNAYARYNPYMLIFEQDQENPAVVNSKIIAMFSLVPSISYAINF
ncbi:TonB-dependent receptor [Persicobacter diffluens]|uniref:Collagen-binding protein n=1 Tax=Persicobacter diffluens TaxID=981 RepID=A0AAN5ALD3_9BACT|nr:collagen-binding protein [Persicobacter diffluens]